MKNVGQTGRPFRVRFEGHFLDYKYANIESKFVQHLPENSHSFGPIDDSMDVLYTTNKSRLLDTMERVYTFKETRINNQINNETSLNPI